MPKQPYPPSTSGPFRCKLAYRAASLAGGEISFLQDAEATLSAIYKRPVQLDPSFVSRKQPVPPRVFLARMLNNLKQVGAPLLPLAAVVSGARLHVAPRRPCPQMYSPRRNCAEAHTISCYMYGVAHVSRH